MVHDRDDRHDEFAGTEFGAGRYRTLRRVGGGGMAVVHEAHDRALDRIVAVKRLRGELAEDVVARSRFAREAEHAAALNHPAVVQVYDTGEDPGKAGPVPWIVMELVEGVTLRALLRHEGPLAWPRALHIVAHVLDALEYSHGRGIVHRDIKPVNVMVTEDGAVKVMDFGIARAVQGTAAPLTAAGHIMGTPQYFSPEQALGHPATPRSDVYSVGCLLYELLVGTVPFDGDSAITVAYKHVRDEPVRPSAYRADIPGTVDDLVLHALRKDPQLRFGSAAEMRAAVARCLPDGASGMSAVIVAPGGGAHRRRASTSTGRRAQRADRARRRMLAYVAGALVCVVAAVLAVVLG
ncbi:protein kinase domain-containing protein [Yinghuangia seranimata]|uniref:protein kinase domain-containing protein n=1 Tax=Yinghuangia seranimata TaxID=408067 RepID=UPI00248BC029|nr:protein kinase [Yinghuangia seranimata]MDI2131920.1 protein kinase [Yinghuangia seranimata]